MSPQTWYQVSSPRRLGPDVGDPAGGGLRVAALPLRALVAARGSGGEHLLGAGCRRLHKAGEVDCYRDPVPGSPGSAVPLDAGGARLGGGAGGPGQGVGAAGRGGGRRRLPRAASAHRVRHRTAGGART